MKNDGERHEDTLADAFRTETPSNEELISAMTTPVRESNYSIEHTEFPDFEFWTVSHKTNWRYIFHCEDLNSAQKLVVHLDAKDKRIAELESLLTCLHKPSEIIEVGICSCEMCGNLYELREVIHVLCRPCLKKTPFSPYTRQAQPNSE